MSVLVQLLRESRGVVLLAVATSLIGGFGNAALLALINQALGAPAPALARLGGLFLVVGVVVLATRTLSQTLFMKLGQQAKATLRMRTIHRLGAASFPHLERQGAAKSLAILTQDLDTVVTCFISLPALTMQSAVVVGCLVYLGYLSWTIFALAVATIVLGTVGYRVAHVKALFHLRASRRREDELIKQFRALFDGAKELKLHRARKRAFIDDTLATHVEAVRVQRTRGYVLYSAAASWGNFILFAFIGITLFVFGRHLNADPHVMSGYAIVFVYMIMPIEAVLSAIPALSSARVALERIDQVLAQLPSEDATDGAGLATGAARPAAGDPAHEGVFPPAFGRITLDAVTHHYHREKENDVFMLGPVDLSFAPGELVYLIGGNGSGKTTLAKMLVGLYPPESGRILVDGVPVDARNRDAYRQQFSVVFSDFFLFDNLLGMRTADLDEQALALLRALQLDHKVQIRDGAFSTLALSQGQRKRLALLVAYLEDRPFYLFDEWAADQDPMFKDVFYRQLLPALRDKGKTVVVITHDDRYFHLADRYIKLDGGQIRERGRGADLAPDGGAMGRASSAAHVAPAPGGETIEPAARAS